MFESIEQNTFQPTTFITSASPVYEALQDTVQGTAPECEEVQGVFTIEGGYSIEQVMSICSIARRTAFKYAAEILEVWFWLPEYKFRVNGIYSELALAELKRRKALGNLDNYRSVVHGENAEAIASWKAKQQPIEESTQQLIDAELVDESTSSMIYIPDVQGLSRLDLARKRQSEVQNRLTKTLEEFKEWDEALNAEIVANQQATQVEGEANFDEKVIDLLLRKKAEKDRLKKLETLIDSGAISADELLKRYAAASSSKQPVGNG